MMKKRQGMAWMVGLLVVLACAGCGKVQTGTDAETGIVAETSEQENDTSEQTANQKEEQMPETQEWHFGTQKREQSSAESMYQGYFYYVPQVEYFYADNRDYIQLTTWHNQAAMEAINQDIQDTYNNMIEIPLEFQGSEIIKRTHPYKKEYDSVYGMGCTNYAMSVQYDRYLEFYIREDDYEDCCRYFQTAYKTYDLNTGKELQLRDLFYEDTDYVTLLNDMIAEWEIKRSDFGERKPFAGITENQQFYISYGGLTIVLDEANYDNFYIPGREFAQISAFGANSDSLEAIKDFSEIEMLSVDGSIRTVEKEVRPSYAGIDGLDENVLWVERCEAPEAVWTTLKTLPICTQELIASEQVYELVEILGPNLLGLERQILISKTGPVYNVQVGLEFKVDYSNWNPTDAEREYYWKYGDCWENESLLVDDAGNILDPLDIFTVDVAGLFAEKVREYWQENPNIGWMQEYLQTYSEETLQEVIPTMEVSMDWSSYNLSAEEVGFSVPWKKLYPYLK